MGVGSGVTGGGLISSPDIGAGISVADATGTERVRVGKIASNPDDYGIKVTSSDGTTVIIDGTSDIFKIVATGTLSLAWPAIGTFAQTTVNLNALGSGYTVTPSALLMVAYDVTASNTSRWSGVIPIVHSPMNGTLDSLSYGAVQLSAGVVQVGLVEYSLLAVAPGSGTGGLRYYVLAETGL